ncbi:unnamed protein product [Cuscuta epithymum]|uniref:Alpha/beta hydrolase fold-3 domain-containing protein n=1 Tax=Cuscuta epithymum TaxID=186058 RepID=A0AAV0ERC0_9ASTE|nr:unnamed protein product [Cuscuta epithymum]
MNDTSHSNQQNLYLFHSAMASPSSTKVVHDFFPLFRVYEDGRVERALEQVFTPPSDNPATGVRSRDVVIVPEHNVRARLYLPKITCEDQKLPVLVYIHGGAFVLNSASSSMYDSYLHALTAKAKVLTVSVDYRLAPEHKLPACYDDSWAVIQWVVSHAQESGPGSDPWLKSHADLTRVFLAGDSAGGNIAHNMMVRAGGSGLKPAGMILDHPYFGTGKPHELWDKVWECIYPESTGMDDPTHNPAASLEILSGLLCSKIMLVISEKDFVREGGLKYYEALKKSGWGGKLELVDVEGEEHVFHLLNPTCEKAGLLMDRAVAFLNSL